LKGTKSTRRRIAAHENRGYTSVRYEQPQDGAWLMNRYHLISLILTVTGAPAASIAQDTDLSGLAGSYRLAQNRDYNDVVNGLTATNYEIEEIGTTLLGRTRILANNGLHRREVVVSRTTGEVLSDMVLDMPNDPQAVARRAALAAASEPKTDDVSSPLEFGGSLSIGVNSESGGYGRATVNARQRNLGGSNVDVGVSLSKGFD
jgi:hypothetical protein